jgi:hypothetical protein
VALGELRRQLLEAIAAPRNERDPVPARGQRAGKLGADPRRGACD